MLRSVLASGILLLAVASSAQAQEPTVDVEARVVGGSIMPPNSIEPMELLFEFTGNGPSLAGAIRIPGVEHLRMEMTDTLVTDEVFSFSFVNPAGTHTAECSLERQSDRSLRGECVAADGAMEIQIDAVDL